MMRAVTPSVQAEADTSSASERAWDDQSPAASLSSISRSAVAASGTRQRFRQHHEQRPLPGGQRIGMEEILDPAEAAGMARMPSMRRLAYASIRRSDSAVV